MLTAAFVVVVNNGRLFSLLGERLDSGTIRGWAFLLTVYLLLTGMLSLVFLLLGHRHTLRSVPCRPSARR